MLAPRSTGLARRVRGLTLLELVITAAITAVVAAAGASLIYASSAASQATGDVRSTATTGNYALGRIGRAIREARGIGEIRSDAISLWIDDANDDDVVNLDETALIRYDAASRQLIYERTASASGTVVAPPMLADSDTLAAALDARPKKSQVWAENVTSATFAGNPPKSETQFVSVEFTLDSRNGDVAFLTCAAPRASGDYLLVADSSYPPLAGSTRKRRKYVPSFNGVSNAAAHGGQTMGP